MHVCCCYCFVQLLCRVFLLLVQLSFSISSITYAAVLYLCAFQWYIIHIFHWASHMLLFTWNDIIRNEIYTKHFEYVPENARDHHHHCRRRRCRVVQLWKSHPNSLSKMHRTQQNMMEMWVEETCTKLMTTVTTRKRRTKNAFEQQQRRR